MNHTTILPSAGVLKFDCGRSSGGRLVLVADSRQSDVRCPGCGTVSERRQGRYARKVADVSMMGIGVEWELHVRKFFCDVAACPRRVFTERLAGVVQPHGRKTERLTETIRSVGKATGGEGGARTLSRLGIAVGADTVRRLIRTGVEETSGSARVVGIDDFAFRRGRNYGTIVVDLEARKVIDVLPDRTAETPAAWLERRPEVEIVSRDRAGAYAEGATRGAPRAVQTADRWHLMKNLGDALVRMLDSRRGDIEAACVEAARSNGAVDKPKGKPVEASKAEGADAPATRMVSDSLKRRERRLDRYRRVVELRGRGESIRKIAREVGLSRQTVVKFLRAGSFPERADRVRKPGVLDPFVEFIRERWTAGCRNAARLWRELRERGFQGSSATVRLFCRRLPDGGQVGGGSRGKSSSVPVISARRAMWMLTLDPTKPTGDERRVRDALLAQSPDIAAAADLGRRFLEMVRKRGIEQLDQWLIDAGESGSLDLKGFAAGLRRDEAAVRAALEFEWSNGQTEGQVNRLKTLKRQMYGRAKFDLLRARVLDSG